MKKKDSINNSYTWFSRNTQDANLLQSSFLNINGLSLLKETEEQTIASLYQKQQVICLNLF